MIHEASSGNPSVVNYVMFVAVFSALSLIYLVGASINEAFALSPIIPLAVDALNVLFFLAGGIALAAKLGAHSCSNKVCFIRWLLEAKYSHLPFIVLRRTQFNYQRELLESHQTMSRSAGCHCIPLVRLHLVPGISHILWASSAGRRS